MYVSNWLIGYVFLSVLYIHIECATYTEVVTEYTKLVNAYSITSSTHGDPYSQTIPTDNLPMEVTLTLNMYSLAGFDPVAGTIDIVGSLNMEWIDEIATASSPSIAFSSGTVSSLLVEYTSIWTPVIILVNSANSVERVGDSSYKARYYTSTGRVTWQPRIILKASCTPDVSFFPFDQQTCTLTFQSWIHDSTLVQLQVNTSSWGMDDYETNGIWSIVDTKSTVVLKGGYYIAEFELDISRNALYFTINIVFPILLLSALSGCLFLLPAASGERVGFGITCFLSFVVLLQITMSFLPEASAPMSILCYYVIIMMTLSAVLSIVNILLVKIHMADEGVPLPKWLVHFVEFVNCTKFKRWRRNRSNGKSDIESPVSFQMDGSVSDSVTRSSSLLLQNSELRNDAKQDFDVQIDKNNVSRQTKGIPNGKRQSPTCGVTKRANGVRRRSGDDDDLSTSRDNTSILSSPDTQGTEDDEKPDWVSVGNFLDFFFLLVFIVSQIMLSVIFLAPLASRAS